MGELRGNLKEIGFQCIGHIVRRNEECVGKRMRTWTVGKRKPGRPKRK